MNIYVTENCGSYERTISIELDCNNANEVNFAKAILEMEQGKDESCLKS